MKRAATILGFVGALALIFGILSYRIGSQLGWHSPMASGVYLCTASVAILLVVGALNGIDWIRKSVRIQ
jgi:hypothetical protein